MKFSLSVEKKNKQNLGGASGHNQRTRPTKSQLPEPAWFSKKGHHSIVAWDESKLDNAKTLSKRKDAVLAIELVFQVGDQTDWRELPCEKWPCGKPKRGIDAQLQKLTAGVKEAVEKEFGKNNVVSIDLHLDESSPHVHVIVTPVTADNKLQAKKWLDGPKTLGAMRARLHATLSKHIESTYRVGGPGGEPIDVSKRAGASNAPQPALHWSKRLLAAASVPKALATLLKQFEDLTKKYNDLFGKVKSLQRQLMKKDVALTDAKAEAAKKVADAASEVQMLRRSAQLQIERLTGKNRELEGYNDELASENHYLKRNTSKAEFKSPGGQ